MKCFGHILPLTRTEKIKALESQLSKNAKLLALSEHQKTRLKQQLKQTQKENRELKDYIKQDLSK
jgi:hypothetical protein